MTTLNTAIASSSIAPTSKKGKALRRLKKLEDDRSSFRSHYIEISDYILPRRGIYLLENQASKGRKRNNKIVDSTATQSVRTMSAGMMSGMTSPARPWHRRRVKGRDDLNERADVRQWLEQVSQVERDILNASNFYQVMPTTYTELGGFGTAAVYRQPSISQVVWYRPFTAGEYVIAENAMGKVDTLGRTFQMSVYQIVAKFLANPMRPNDKPMWEKASPQIQRLWDAAQYDDLVTVSQLIEPRPLADRDFNNPTNRHMAYRSIYFELSGDRDTMLSESGYKTFPAYVPRWDILHGEVYGRGPGMDTLGDVKQLQHEQKRKAQAIDKMVNPPMTAPTSLKGKPSTTLPGHTTYVDPQGGTQGFAPAYLVQPRVAELMQSIAEIQERIQRGFYADLFAMMINSDRRQITATEVAERHEEKLVLLGPVLQQLNTELLDPALDDAFTFATERGMIPEPPAVLQEEDVEFDVQYVSLLAQAQQAVSAAAIERTMSFAGNLVAVFPDVVDNIDADEAVRHYGDVMGVPADILRDADQVAEIRTNRAAKEQQAEGMAAAQAGAGMAAQGAQAAKVLSETDAGGPNLLTEMLSGVG